MKESLTEESLKYSAGLLKNLNDLRLGESLCDVEISSSSSEELLYAHRNVLAAASPYFKAMFCGGLAEENREKIVMKSLNSRTLRTLLDYIYSGDEGNVTRDNVQELLIAGDMIGLKELVNICTSYLVRELDTSNAVGIYRFATDHHCSDLARESGNYIREKFVTISTESEEFRDLSKELLSEFLESEYLRVDSEYQVFFAAMNWIEFDIRKRRRFVFEILKNVRLPLVPFKLLDSYINNCSDLSLKVALSSVKKDMIQQKGSLVSSLFPLPRIAAKKNVYVIGGSRKELECAWSRTEYTYCTVEMFDTFQNEWKEVASMKKGRILPGLAVLCGKIYVCGGELESEILADGEIYDPLLNTWTDMAPMTIARCEFGMTALDEYIYAFGGWVGDDIGASIERYDPRVNQWTVIATMPTPRFSMGIFSYMGLIYIVGGCTHTRSNMQEFVSFNPITEEWTSYANMLVPRSQMGCAVLDNHLYVVGGTNRKNEVLRCVERYSFKENKWEEIPSMFQPRESPCVAASNGKLYVFGGGQLNKVDFYRSPFTISSGEFYDPLTNTWDETISLPNSRSEAGVVVL